MYTIKTIILITNTIVAYNDNLSEDANKTSDNAKPNFRNVGDDLNDFIFERIFS